ncbi:MAG: HAD family hydrolase [bacterium]|nr:HAD family hydrolase [bacterium]
MPDAAIFLDRDNTLIEDPGFISHPDQVKLLPGTAEALRRLRAGGYRIIVVSNQSGVARGLFDEEQLGRIHARLGELLAAEGVNLDEIRYCPYLDGEEAVVEAYRQDSPLRKPRPGMLLEAARQRNLDLSRSWMIGDRMSDVQAGAAAPCRTILVGPAPAQYNGGVTPDHVVSTLLEAARVVEEHPDTPPPRRERAGEEPQLELLAEIRDALQRGQRRDSQEDFSFVRLIGALMQMLAIATALWGIVGIFSGTTGAAVARLGLAIFLQLLAMMIHLAYRRL